MILIHGEPVVEHETEWGVRVPNAPHGAEEFEAIDRSEAAFLARGMGGKVIRREVYTTVWLEVL